MTRQLAIIFLVGAVALTFGTTSYAGTILGVESISGGGNAVVDPIFTGDPNNDDHTEVATSNIVVAGKLFSAVLPIDIVFEVDDSQGTTEYRVAEGVANVSGQDFLMYEFQLGFGTGANFQLAAAGNGLDFDHPNVSPGPTSARFMTMAHSEKQVRFTMGTLPDGMTDAFTLSIDVPDFDSASMPAAAQVAGGYRFTLRQLPSIIPEPGTIGIAVLSALAWAVFTLRRRWG